MDTTPEPTNVTSEKILPERPHIRRRRSGRPSLVFPLLLILLGVIFLLKNTNIIQGNAWDFILKLWPLILIALGLDSLFRSRNVVAPVFWIGLGVVFLLSTLDLIALGVLDIILRLWPLFLVAIGLDIFIGRRSFWLSLAGSVILMVIMVGSLFILGQGTVASSGGQAISKAIGAATQAQVNLNPAVGNLVVKAIPVNDSTANVVQGQAYLPGAYTLTQNYTVNEAKGFFDLGLENQNGIHVFTQSWDWNLAFTRKIPLNFNVNMGAGVLDLDFSQMQLNGLNLSLGVGAADVTLPAKGNFSGSLNSAIGQMTVHVPQGAPVRIIADGLAIVNAPPDFTSQDRVYSSPAFASATDRIVINLSQAIGLVRIEYVK